MRLALALLAVLCASCVHSSTFSANIFPTQSGFSQASGPPGLRVDTYTGNSKSTPGNVGLCISGGGSRSLSLAWGQLRALYQLGLLSQTKAISSVSGGTWASIPYTFLPDTIDDATFLGPYVSDLSQLTLTGLANSDKSTTLDYLFPGSLGNVPTSDGLDPITAPGTLYQWYQNGYPADRLWIRLIGENVLKPFGLWDADSEHFPTRFFCPDTATCEAIKTANPNLGNYFAVNPNNRPFHIAMTSMFVRPTGEAASDTYKYVAPVHSTAWHTGIPSSPAATYQDASGTEQSVGGGGVTSFAFNSQITSNPDSSNGVSVTQTRPFALADITGASSAAFAEEFTNKLHILQDVDPSFDYWTVQNPTPGVSGTVKFADGGIQDNSGIAAMLAYQDIDNLIAFINTDQPMSKDSAGIIMVADMIPPLFGMQPYVKGTGYTPYPALPTELPNNLNTEYRFNQVFDQSQFQPLVDALWAMSEQGNGVAYLQSGLTVQQNDWFGVPGGATVNVVWVYAQPQHGFRKPLISTVTDYLSTIDPNFPNVDTFFTKLTATTTNLLGHYGAWVMMQHQTTIQNLFTSSALDASASTHATDVKSKSSHHGDVAVAVLVPAMVVVVAVAAVFVISRRRERLRATRHVRLHDTML